MGESLGLKKFTVSQFCSYYPFQKGMVCGMKGLVNFTFKAMYRDKNPY